VEGKYSRITPSGGCMEQAETRLDPLREQQGFPDCRGAMPHLRSGAALILALILLAALLLLGLPFLYSQSSSLSGTRSFSAQRLAVIGQANARNVATAVAHTGAR
jgi:hypothetical protein